MRKIDENSFGCQGTKVIELVRLVRWQDGRSHQFSALRSGWGLPARWKVKTYLKAHSAIRSGQPCGRFFWLNEGSILTLDLFPYLHKILYSRNVVHSDKSRIPAAYPTAAFLASLAYLTIPRINNSRVFNYRDGVRLPPRAPVEIEWVLKFSPSMHPRR